jgi:glycosyltransferase involved in cell wall biosynthesis
LIDQKYVELSIIVPTYNEKENVEEFIRRIIPILSANTSSYEIIFAIDPSTDGTEKIIASLAQQNPNVKGLVFSRRFGQPTATLAGLEHCKGNSAIVMDVDLQDPPELIPEMLEKWREGFEVVCAKRRHRDGETLVKLVVSKVGYAVINRFGEVKIPRDTGDFRLIDRKVIDQLKRFPEAHGFLRGLVALVGYKQTEVLFDRPSRFSGKGNYNQWFGSLRIGFNGLVGFSSALLNLATVAGFVSAFFSFIFGSIYVLAQLVSADFPVGNPTIVFLVLLIGGIQLICLGIIGQYIGRIYDEVKRRPRFIVSETIGDLDLK